MIKIRNKHTVVAPNLPADHVRTAAYHAIPLQFLSLEAYCFPAIKVKNENRTVFKIESV
jgi:hypothetical protein